MPSKAEEEKRVERDEEWDPTSLLLNYAYTLWTLSLHLNLNYAAFRLDDIVDYG